MSTPTPSHHHPTRHSSAGLHLLRWLREIAIVVVAVLAIQVGLVQAFHVPTGSMERTVMSGDYLLVDKLTLGPRTPDWLGVPWTDLGVPIQAFKLPGLRAPRIGDIVVVRTPLDRRVPYVKRVVAVGGQTVEVRDKVLYIDGVAQPDPPERHPADHLLYPRGIPVYGIPPTLGSRDNWGPLQVPDGQIFLMGDNRDNSVDSRFFGPIPVTDVLGLARLVYFSWDASGDAGLHPWERPRWGRLGQLVH